MMINYIFLILFNKNYIKIKNLYIKNFIKYHLFDFCFNYNNIIINLNKFILKSIYLNYIFLNYMDYILDTSLSCEQKIIYIEKQDYCRKIKIVIRLIVTLENAIL